MINKLTIMQIMQNENTVHKNSYIYKKTLQKIRLNFVNATLSRK